jgi:peptide/nickel transport system ATP-binding protein
VTPALLDVEALTLSIAGLPVLNGVDLKVRAGEIVGLVGESGSGKSMTALAIMRLAPLRSEAGGRIRILGEDILGKSEREMQRIRGRAVSMVFQEPMTALNPVQTIGAQVAEGIRLHLRVSRAEALSHAREALDRVGLAAIPLDRYPHELSGGQRQRVVIAIAAALSPKLLLADEPTTALDVTVQAQILDLMRGLVAETGMGLLLITHDLGVVAGTADRVAVMRQGVIVEEGPTLPFFRTMRHPYSRRLREAASHVPARPRVPTPPADAQPALAVADLQRTYRGRRRTFLGPRETVAAVNGVSFAIPQGRSVGLVGESGCGKSTLARTALALERPQGGRVAIAGHDPFALDPGRLRALRRHVQPVFQDPYGSFDPRHRAGRLIAEPLHLLGRDLTREEAARRVAEALLEVGLAPEDAEKYPHEFSGGQRQRLAIARALITRPDLIVADEPVSALDVSIRASILDLFAGLRESHGLSYLFISHDLSVVRAVTDEVLVMRAGEIVERGPTAEVFADPQHPYTKALAAAAPDLERELRRREAEETQEAAWRSASTPRAS